MYQNYSIRSYVKTIQQEVIPRFHLSAIRFAICDIVYERQHDEGQMDP